MIKKIYILFLLLVLVSVSFSSPAPAEEINIDDRYIYIPEENRKHPVVTSEKNDLYTPSRTEPYQADEKKMPVWVKKRKKPASTNAILKTISQSHKNDNNKILDNKEAASKETVLAPAPVKTRSLPKFKRAKKIIANVDLGKTIAVVTLGFGILMFLFYLNKSQKKKKDFFPEIPKEKPKISAPPAHEHKNIAKALDIIAARKPVFTPQKPAPQTPLAQSTPDKKTKSIGFHKVIEEKIEKHKQKKSGVIAEDIPPREPQEVEMEQPETKMQPIEKILEYKNDVPPAVREDIKHEIPDKYQKIFELAKLGHSLEAISRETGFGIGEVEVVLNLHLPEAKRVS